MLYIYHCIPSIADPLTEPYKTMNFLFFPWLILFGLRQRYTTGFGVGTTEEKRRRWIRYSSTWVHRILDLGCGTGGNAIALAELGYEVVGIDISEAMIERARRKAKGLENVEFRVLDMRSLDFDKEFDAAICLGAASAHLLSDEDLHHFLDGVHRALRPNGLLILHVYDKNSFDHSLLGKPVPGETLTDGGIRARSRIKFTLVSEDPLIVNWESFWFVFDRGGLRMVRRSIPMRWYDVDRLENALIEHNFDIGGVSSSLYNYPLLRRTGRDRNVHVFAVKHW